MVFVFLVLLIASMVCYFFAAIKESSGFLMAAMILGAVAGIILIIITVQAPSKTKVNMFFLGTLIIIMCVGVPGAVGFNIGNAIRKKKKSK